jgi:hypothetical protein
MVTPLARATSRQKGRAEAPSPQPWLAVVLAVDTAARSGWAISVSGRRVDSGEADTLDTTLLDRVVHWAVDLADLSTLPLVMVLESPWGGNVHIVAALGVARERWLRAWRDAGQAPGRVVKVMPGTWRGPVLGREWVSAPRDQVRAHEQRVARALMGRDVGPDEAPAILIARWASHAAPVGKAIGKRAAKASLREWTQPKAVT